jgi:hypothetical protein
MDGDNGFYGVDTRSNPATLKAGILQDGNNIRLDLATMQVRKGVARLLDDSQAVTVGSVLGAGTYIQPNGTEKIVLVTVSGLYLFDIITETLSEKFPFPVGRTITEGPVEILQAVNKIYILRGEASKYITGSGATGQQATVNSGGHVVTVTTSVSHGLTIGSEFVIETNHAEWNGPTATENFVVASVPTANSFTYNLVTAHSGASSGYVVQVAKPVLVFDGVNVKVVRQGTVDGTYKGGSAATACDFPPCSTAIYHKNRIYCKYSRDEIAVSDYLTDSTGNWQFDLTIQALAVNIGDEQEIVGFHPWTRDEILVFKNNSIYAAKFADNTSTPDIVLADSYVRSLTYDIGCIAKNSVANVSGYVFFLSQRGVYKLEPQLDVNLLANTAPMSTSIQKYIDRINIIYAHKAVATVYNGRYYLAVPLDSATENNAVFIYNLTNQQWESVDTYPASFHANGIFVAKSGTTNVSNRMFFWTISKGLYLAEEKEVDEVGHVTSAFNLPVYLPFYLSPIDYEYTQISGYAKTRRYTYNTLQNKRFVSIATDVDFNGQGVIRTNAIGYNPDTNTLVDIATSASRSDKTRRFPVRKVAVGLEIDLTTLQARPTVKSVQIEAVLIGRNLKSES